MSLQKPIEKIFWAVLYLFLYAFLLYELNTTLAPTRMGGFMELSGFGAPLAALACFIGLASIRAKASASFSQKIPLVFAAGVFAVLAHAFYQFPPALDLAYYWNRYNAHPVWGKWDYTQAGLSSFVLTASLCFWFICQAFPLPKKKWQSIPNYIACFIGIWYTNIYIVEHLFSLLSSNSKFHTSISLICISILCMLISRKIKIMPLFILSFYFFLTWILFFSLFYIYKIPPYK